jgi:osmotically-inducible protein OsmY
MKTSMVLLILLAAVGCSKNEDPSANRSGDQMAVPADDTGRNARDRNGVEPTAQNQPENAADRTITQQIRKQVVGQDDLSINGKNVKIVTVDGVVTLRGPVQSEKERLDIGSVAKNVDGVKRVDNQLEIASK